MGTIHQPKVNCLRIFTIIIPVQESKCIASIDSPIMHPLFGLDRIFAARTTMTHSAEFMGLYKQNVSFFTAYSLQLYLKHGIRRKTLSAQGSLLELYPIPLHITEGSILTAACYIHFSIAHSAPD